MTTGNILYLLMSLGMFGLFSVVLAYQSWQQSRTEPDVKPIAEPDEHHAVTA